MKKYKYGTVEMEAPADEYSRLAEIVAVGIVEGDKGKIDECLADNVDPITARDLDDALSCEALPDGTFRVGVHIADRCGEPDRLEDIAFDELSDVLAVDYPKIHEAKFSYETKPFSSYFRTV